jgi:hypothetical protein
MELLREPLKSISKLSIFATVQESSDDVGRNVAEPLQCWILN